jgi:hypothetical protein
MVRVSQRRAAGGDELCGRPTKAGGTCKQAAGHGTDHVGYGACKHHAGNAPAQRKVAVRAMAAAEAERFAVTDELPIAPEDALLWAVRLSAGAVTWLRAQVERGDDWGAAPLQLRDEKKDKLERVKQNWFEVYGEERDRLARTAKMAVDAGIARRQVELAEAEANFVYTGLMTALRAIKATPAQIDAAGAALLQYLETAQAPMTEIRREITVGRR